MSSKNLSLFFDCVYVLNKDASQISRINLLNLLLIRQHLMNRQLMFQLQVTTLKMNHRNSRLKQLHQHLRQHHLLTTQRTKRVQTQTIKYQKKTEQLHHVETQSFFISVIRTVAMIVYIQVEAVSWWSLVQEETGGCEIMYINQTAVNYIRQQMRGFKPEFVKCVIRCFELIDSTQQPDGCLGNSVALYICAKEFGYSPKLCYGLCKVEEISFYHAWLEINGIIIDPSIYGNVNFNPKVRQSCQTMLNTPYIGAYKTSTISYGRYEFDENWRSDRISKAEGMSFEQYMDNAPDNWMWWVTCRFLNKLPVRKTIKHLRTLIKKDVILPESKQ